MPKNSNESAIQKQLSLLQDDLARLQSRCAGLPLPTDVTLALRQFKELGPGFEAVAAFTSIMQSNIERLDEERRRQLAAKLLELNVALWNLHLQTAEPRLRRMEDNVARMPIGSRFVIERWVKHLDGLRDEPEVSARLDGALLSRVDALSRQLARDAPDLRELD